MTMPTSQKNITCTRALNRFKRMLILPFAWKTTYENQRSGFIKRLTSASIGADQKTDAFDGGEASDIEEDWPLSEG